MSQGGSESWKFETTDVLEARRRIQAHVRRTPLAHSAWLSERAGADVWMKLESLQLTGSFKVRGALNFVRRFVECHRARSGQADTPLPALVTASAGNHGQALAYAAGRFGIRPIIFTARDAPRTKLNAIRRYGADLRSIAQSYDECEVLAKAFARSANAVYLSPYSHPDILAATGTIALEILEDMPDVEEVVVPVGGGGLVSGIAATLARVAPSVIVTGVEAAASPAFTTSLREGRLTKIEVLPTLADGLAGNLDPETVTFDLVRTTVRRIIQVSEDDLAHAIAGLVAREHLVVEGAGAAGVASLLQPDDPERRPKVVVVVSGANIDAERLLSVFNRGAGPGASR
jgi:threonine dehydratase